MEKKHSQFKQQKLQKTKSIPYVRYNKETEEWIMTSKLINIPKENNIKIHFYCECPSKSIKIFDHLKIK